jgi:filamentous hemagglutinin
LQVDVIGYAGGSNLYAYGANDPLNRTDRLGKSADEPESVAGEEEEETTSASAPSVLSSSTSGALSPLVGNEEDEESATESEGVGLALTYKPGWTADQIAAADAKVQFLNDADTVVTSVNRGGFSARSTFSNAGGIVSPTQDVDHLLDLQLGGQNTLSNLWPLDSSVNRSLGAQIQQQIQGLSPGTVINNVTIGPR